MRSAGGRRMSAATLIAQKVRAFMEHQQAQGIADSATVHPADGAADYQVAVMHFPAGPEPDGGDPAHAAVEMLAAVTPGHLLQLGDQVEVPNWIDAPGVDRVTGIIDTLHPMAPGGEVIGQFARARLPLMEVEG